jgi:AraC-like DNA-binding protein
MRNRTILTKQVLATIPELVAQGLRRNEIAERLGCKASTLQVRCSQNGISLRPGVRQPAEWYTTVRLNRAAIAMLREKAVTTGESESALARRLLETIARDNLYNTVLDDAA